MVSRNPLGMGDGRANPPAGPVARRGARDMSPAVPPHGVRRHLARVQFVGVLRRARRDGWRARVPSVSQAHRCRGPRGTPVLLGHLQGDGEDAALPQAIPAAAGAPVSQKRDATPGRALWRLELERVARCALLGHPEAAWVRRVTGSSSIQCCFWCPTCRRPVTADRYHTRGPFVAPDWLDTTMGLDA